jgi:hypothetical protein
MSIYEKLKTFTMDQMCTFWYLNAKPRGIKKTKEFLEAEYNSDNCHVID